jgi:hypothetical protein
MVNSFLGICDIDRNVILVRFTFTSGWPLIQALLNTGKFFGRLVWYRCGSTQKFGGEFDLQFVHALSGWDRSEFPDYYSTH